MMFVDGAFDGKAQLIEGVVDGPHEFPFVSFTIVKVGS